MMTSNNQAQGIQRNNATSTGIGSAPGIFVFEADTAAFANRKRAARACASCQKRKKRCPHTFSKSQDGLGNGASGGSGNDGAEKILPNLTHKEPIRFVGDLNPESILAELSTREKGVKRFSRIGTWVEQSRLRSELLIQEEAAAAASTAATAANENASMSTSAEQLLKSNKPSDVSVRQAAVERYSKIERGRRTLTGHQKNYLQAVGAFRVLPKATEDALVTTYITCIDPLLPIIDDKKFLTEYTAGEASVFLVQAICLVACKTEEAAPHLRLYEDGPLLDPIPFARSLHTGLDAAMKADLEADRFTKVQIMTLMSLHNDGPGGIEESSSHLVQAIHDAQTTGMHINTPGRTRNDQGAQLWWVLWMLDKYNACLGGRPLMIAERDIDIEEVVQEDNPRSQSLAVWLALGHLLDKIIEFYRPIADPDATGWERDFPSWSALTSECDLEALLPSHRRVLEVCYNIIGILACRSGGPSTRSYNRRIECADRIQSLVSEGGRTHLPPIPLVPYAVSLSLTVVYRGLRDHHTETTKGLADLSTRCDMLESLSKKWWTADAMAKLGRKALKSLQHPLQPQQQNRTGEIADALDAEVSICKYGPFTDQKNGPSTRVDPLNPDTERVTSSSSRGQASTIDYDEVTGNALHVLSDAAATHGRPKGSSKSKRFNTSELNSNDIDISAKRRRMKPARHSLSGMDQVTPSSTTSGSTPNASTMDTPILSHAGDILPLAYSTGKPTPSSSTNLDPSLQSPAPANLLQTTTQNHNIPTSATAAPFQAFTDYSDLDNLFDGFFDLSMPTIFQDPLFDGAAFFDNGPPGFDDYNFMDTSSGPVPNNGFEYVAPPPPAPTPVPGTTPSAAFSITSHSQIDPRISMNLAAFSNQTSQPHRSGTTRH